MNSGQGVADALALHVLAPSSADDLYFHQH
jgi:hypothetical protein